MPTDVVFDFGFRHRPAIPADDAVELAELLDRQGMAQKFETASHSLSAVVLAAQIKEQAGVFPNGQPMPDDYKKTQDRIEPGEFELMALSEFLATEPWAKSRPWFEKFQDEVNRQIDRATDAKPKRDDGPWFKVRSPKDDAEHRSWAIPAEFDETFLDWFRDRTEEFWATVPRQRLRKALARYVRMGIGGSSWQRKTRWTGGLSDDEIGQAERRWGLRFPPDYRLFLQRLHAPDRPMLGAHFEDKGHEPPSKTLGRTSWDEEQDMVLSEEPSFYNWLSDVDALQDAFNWLVEGLEYDVEWAELWEPGWGPKPATLDEQKARVRELVGAAPKLIPVIGHRFSSPNLVFRETRCSRSISRTSSCTERTCATSYWTNLEIVGVAND